MPDLFDEVAPARDIFDEVATPAPETKPFPFAPYAGAGEMGAMPPGLEFQSPRLPRVGYTPQPDDTEPLALPGEGPLSHIMAGVTKGSARKVAPIIANAALSGVEGVIDPKTQAIILGATVQPEVVIPLLTATMAKSGSTKLAESLVDFQQGHDSEGVVKAGEAGTELAFSASPALHPSAFTARPSVVPERPLILPRARAALEEPTPELGATPTPAQPAPALTTEVPNALHREAETPVRNVQQPGGTLEGAGQMPANVASEEAGARSVAGGDVAAQEKGPLLLTPDEQAAARAQLAAEVPAAQPVEVPAPRTAEDIEMARVRALPEGAAGEAQLASGDIAKAVDTVRVDDIAGYSPVPALVRLIRRAARDPAMKTAAEQAMQKIGQAAREQGVPLDDIQKQVAGELSAIYGADAAEMAKHYFGEAPKPAPAPEPPAPPASAAPSPALTLLGLTEDKFALPSLRKLSRDTLRRLANSLGTEATVPAVARRAAERFAEMRQQPPGPVGMGGALAAEMSGTDAPLAGTPAHAVETGPPSERPLGLTDPTSAPFVSLSLELMGQPSSVPPEFSVDTGLKALAGSSAPRLTAMNRPAGEALVRYASSKIAAPYKALVFSSRVLEKGVNAVKFGAALTEDNLRSVEQNFLRQANEAFEAGDQPAADAAYEKVLNVRSIVGGKNSPFRTEEEYQNFLADPLTQEALKRHVQLWQEDIEPQYKMAQSLDPDVELPTRGQQTGARINLKAVLEGDEPGTRPVTASRGGLTASFKRKSPFAREAKGTGDVYESNYPDIIANTYRRQLEIANQNEMNRILVANDLARIDKPGARVLFGDKPGVPFPLTRRLILTGGEAIPAGQNIYVRPEFAREYRTALNTDAPQRIPFFTEASSLFTRASIAGLGELTTHISNLATGLFTRPNSPLLWDSIAKATGRADVPITVVRALLKAAADNREQVAQLAEIGVVREPAGKPAESTYPLVNVLNMVRGAPRRLIHWADTTVRLTLDDAYKGLADAGIAENTETARREFVNQVGQYNKRLQGQFTVLLRDTGIGPFVTAGKTFNAMGIRNMLLSPGLKATSPMAAAALRANALAGWVGFVTLAATLNWLLTRNKGGGVMGRPGVPTGNIDTGTDDEQGRPISLPLADALGYGRGLRITGARRLIEGARYGLNQNQALDSALGDVVNAAVGPALGPIVRTGFAAATGRPPALNVGRTAPVVGPEQSQFAANVLDALRRANPLVNAAYDASEGKSGLEIGRSQAQRFSPQPGITESKAEAMPRIVSRARLNDFIDDLARRARRLPLADRAAFIRDEMEKAELSGAERVRVNRQIQARTRYP